MIKKLSDRFDQLLVESQNLEASKIKKEGSPGAYDHIDEEKFTEWSVKTKSLISKTCGESSEHIKAFLHTEKTQ